MRSPGKKDFVPVGLQAKCRREQRTALSATASFFSNYRRPQAKREIHSFPMTDMKRFELRGRTPLHTVAASSLEVQEADAIGEEDSRPLLTDGSGGGSHPSSHSPRWYKGPLSGLFNRRHHRHASARPYRHVGPAASSIGRYLQKQWRMAHTYTRFLVSLAIVYGVHYVVWGRLLDPWLAQPQPWPVQAVDVHEFVVVINTYKRPDILPQAVQHYAQRCGPAAGVAQVFVVWAELDVTPPPPSSWLSEHPLRPQSTAAAVHILRVAQDSLNARFLPIDKAKSPAIFMVDDDVRVDCPSLQQGFAAWRTNPTAMVGYYPRLALESKEGQHIYQAWTGVYWHQSANFILTKAAFLHHEYMVLYSNPAVHPVEILDYVDQYKNCEDVAMSLLVANQTSSAAAPHGAATRLPNIVYVEGHVSDLGLTGGISSTGKTQHFHHRSACLRDMSALYVQHGWPVPLRQVQYHLRDITWMRHIPGWSTARPSNFFEWFALANMFQS